MVTRQSTVDTKVSLPAKSTSPPCSPANVGALPEQGIPNDNTTTANTIKSFIMFLPKTYMATGTKINLINETTYTFQSENASKILLLDITIPI